MLEQSNYTMNWRFFIILSISLLSLKANAQDQKMFEASFRLGPYTLFQNYSGESIFKMNGKAEILYNISPKIAVGVDYLYMSVEAFGVSGSNGASFASYFMDGKLQGLGGNFRYTFNPNSRFRIFGQAMAHMGFLTFEEPVIDGSPGLTHDPNYLAVIDQFENKNAFMFGVGTGLNFMITRSLGLTASVDVYELIGAFDEINMMSLSQGVSVNMDEAILIAYVEPPNWIWGYYLGVVFQFGDKKL